MVARNRDQHRRHAEIHPTGRVKGAHARIDEGQPRLSARPRGEACGVRRRRAEAVIGAVHVFMLEPRRILELLHEVVSPMKPPVEGL